MTPLVSVVIVTFNSDHVLRQCLEPLIREEAIEVVLVDNNSSDNTLSMLRRDFPDVVVIENELNVGFARAVNQGVRVCNSEFVFLLNPDAIISAASLLSLVQYLLENPTVGIVSPLVTNPVIGETRIAPAGRAPTIWRMFTHLTGLSRLAGTIRPLEGHYLFPRQIRHRSRSVDWVSGGTLLTRLSLWHELGGLSERWFMYGEDIDFCLRAQREGYHIRVMGTVQASHAIGGSVKGVKGTSNTVWLRNLFDVYCQQAGAGPFKKFAWRTMVSLGYCARSVTFVLQSALLEGERKEMSRGRAMRFWRYARASISLGRDR